MIDVLIFVLLVMLCVVIVMFVWTMYDATDFGDYIRKHKMLRTPPCVRCVYYKYVDGFSRCRCPHALEISERLHDGRFVELNTCDIRGTKMCQYSDVRKESNDK